MEPFAGAVGDDSMVLPLLNGLRHLEMLDDRFATSKILGGQCVIGVTLDAQRVAVHLNDNKELKLGLRHYRSRWQSDKHPGVY
jgi:2-dehydropantoate 2-reductase